MGDNFTITSIEEWLNLGSIELPVLTSEKESGSVFEVKKVGFVLVDEQFCTSKGIKAPMAP